MIVTSVRSAFRRMPQGLRWITGFCLFMSLFIPAALLPVGESRINDVPVSFADFWRLGGGPVFCIIGGWFAVLAYGFIRARTWSRALFVAANCALVIGSIFFGHGSFSSDSAVTCGVLVVLAAWYLFFRQSVKDYFSRSFEKPTT